MEKLDRSTEVKEKIIIIGIGNPDRSDDGVGNKVIDLLEEKMPLDQIPPTKAVWLIDAGTTPEDFSDDIIQYKPNKIIIVDAAQMQTDPGTIKKIPASAIPEASLSTHNLSVRVVAGIWQKITGAEIEFIGIEPQNLDYTIGLSGEIKRAAEKAAKDIINVLRDPGKSN
jgi:hydrogenase 3 maturation protease